MKKINVPKLRFPEFSGDWEGKQIKNILKIKHGKDQKKIISEDGIYPIFGTGGQIGRTNHFIYNKESVLIGRKGTIDKPRYMNTPFWTVDTLFYSHINDSNKPKFVFYLFQTINWKEFDESTGVPSLSASTIENIKTNIPIFSEQTKIADFFTIIDHKIETQEQIVSKLETIKKGYLQKIFSQEIRFKDQDGNEFPEWEEKRVDQLFQVTRGRVIAKTSISDVKNEEFKYPIYSSQTSNNGIMGYDDKFDFEGNYITWTTDGANAGKVFARKGKFNCTNVCGLLVEKLETKGYANQFISESLDRVTRKYVSYVGNPKLMNNVMAEIIINVPSLNEQKIIADFISIFDQKIDVEKQKLEKWKQIKKGLLQQMFV